MIIHEIFIQGISGLRQQVAARPLRVQHGDNSIFSHGIVLEPPVEADWIYKCIRSLLFPTRTSQQVESLFAQGKDARAGIVFSSQQMLVRCIRGANPESIFLQVEKEENGQRVWNTVAKGVQKVEEMFHARFARPTLETFESISYWCDENLFYLPNDKEAAIEEAIDNDLSINSLMIMYENAYSYEQAQVEVGRLSEKLVRRSTGQAPATSRVDPQLEINARHKASLEQSINDLYIEIGQLGLGDISQEEYERVRDADVVVSTTQREIRRLEDSKKQLEGELRVKVNQPWMSRPVLWILSILAITCLVLAPFFSPFIAFGSLLFAGIATVLIFRSTSLMADQVAAFNKLQHLEARLAKEWEQYASARQKTNHFMLAVETVGIAESEQYFTQRQELVQQLAQKQLELNAFLEEVGEDGILHTHDTLLTANRNPNATLIHELESARSALEGAAKPAFSSKAIAAEILKHGVDPNALQNDEPELESLKTQESLLLLQAEQVGCLSQGRLHPDVETLWNHLLHRFMHNSLYFCVENGAVDISKEKSTKPSSPSWKADRPNVFRWVLFSLSCALVEYASSTGQGQGLLLPQTIFCLHPDSLKREDDRRRLMRIITGTKTSSWFLFMPQEKP